ncbi:MAG: phosphate ABC transporter permease subunit PstC [Burkholderiaceae bacterium]
MSSSTLLLFLLVISSFAYVFGRQRAMRVVGGDVRRLQSLPVYYGLYVAFWCAVPALMLLGLWSVFETSIVTQIVVTSLPADIAQMPADKLGLAINDVRNHVGGGITSQSLSPELEVAADQYRGLLATSRVAQAILVLVLSVGLGAWMLSRIHAAQRARSVVERIIEIGLITCSSIAILTTVGIVFSVLFEALRFFAKVPFSDFVFGLQWSPQTALRADQVGSSGTFGAIPLFVGTMLISFIAMCVAVPIGLMSAIYLSEYGSRRLRAVVKPLLEILAGIPTVVYGFFAALTVAPWIRNTGESLGLNVASESALAAGLVMGVMIIPFVSSLSDDVINAVPQALRDGSFGMGATKSETIRKVVLPAALPGVVGSILLALSRAIGETMIVVMAAGLAANLTVNPLDAVTTVTVQIVTLLVGDQEFDSAKTLAAFALGLILFLVTLVLNVIALHIVRRYREQYD